MPTVKPPNSPTLGEFGERVRLRREELGWSQEYAADQIGIHWTQLGRVERGQRSSRIESILKIAAGLQTTPGALMDGLPTVEPEGA
ncbi:helix-turn-helix domain-containing protein [Gordonia sp. LUNF6]|uniref:helix-turn-helix domain-containing protein n=1 Tax=Gordonia sp. LUNF6 TaxID=3388658 RepID=UPI00399A9E77